MWFFCLCSASLAACTGQAGGVLNGEGDSEPGDDDGPGDVDRGGEGGAGQGGSAGPNPGASVGARVTWRRLTQAQLDNVLVDLFGQGIAAGAPEPDLRDHNFLSVGAALATTSPTGVEKLENIAFQLAETIAKEPARRERWVTCDVKAQFRDCTKTSLEKLGLAMFRRPVPDDTLAELVALAEEGKQSFSDPWKGIEFALAAMLQSPRFLYIQERSAEAGAEGSTVALDGYSLASRLSFLLWNSGPDAELLAAAGEGTLDGPEGLGRQVERLWNDARAGGGIREFFASAWGIHKAATRAFDVDLFPTLPASAGASALEAALRALELNLIESALPLGEALLSNTTFVNRDIASVYGLPPLPGPAYSKNELGNDANRHGFLTHAAFLMANSTPDDTQPMLRGRTIRENLLCQEVPDPPPDLMAQLPPLEGGAKQTKRDRLARHREDPFCASCHDPIDPPGLALENYDAAGFHRTSELGLEIDPSGELDGRTFTGPAELTRAIVEHPDFKGCFVKNLYRHATAQLEGEAEQGALEQLTEAFEASGGRVPTLVLELVRSPLFTHVKVPTL